MLSVYLHTFDSFLVKINEIKNIQKFPVKINLREDLSTFTRLRTTFINESV